MNGIKLLILIVILLVFIILGLIIHVVNIRRSLNNILMILEDIEKGNNNRKILAKDKDVTADICYKVNEIVADKASEVIELKKSERAHKQLLTSLSHDVRTPLTSLIGYLDAIYNKVVEGTEKDRYLEIARNKAYSLKDFVDILFEWFKLDSKETTFHFENIDINELTRSILIDWIPIFEKCSIIFYVDIPEVEWNIMLDINAYTRIVNNIIQNALAHSDGDQIEIRTEKKNNTIVIYISDNGKGIAKEEIPHIFERLYKCDESRSYTGNGLGLAIVEELVKAHNGKITVISTPYEKTTFKITMPMLKTL